jgi:phosphoribosylformylglycinamidine cyclo-ligase
VPRTESERAFNCGVGMIAAVAADVADRVVAQLESLGVPAWIAGSVQRRRGDGQDAGASGAHLVGTYR